MRVQYWFFIGIITIPAFADTCNTPGYYLNENNECVACSTNHYCVGDGIMRPCPEFTYSDPEELKSLITGYNVHSVLRANLASNWHYNGQEMTSIEKCVLLLEEIEVDQGRMSRYVLHYSNQTGAYTRTQSGFYTYFVRANPGYYLKRPYYAWYMTTGTCTNSHPTNSHYSGPGTPDSGAMTDANDCPWACDDGYGRHGDECLPLCGAGVTTLHAGNEVVFNVYRDKLSTPSINIKYNNTVCYVNLAQGTGQLNFRYNNTTYHATD